MRTFGRLPQSITINHENSRWIPEHRVTVTAAYTLQHARHVPGSVLLCNAKYCPRTVRKLYAVPLYTLEYRMRFTIQWHSPRFVDDDSLDTLRAEGRLKDVSFVLRRHPR